MVRNIVCVTHNNFYKNILQDLRNPHLNIVFYKSQDYDFQTRQLSPPPDLCILDTEFEKDNQKFFKEITTYTSNYIPNNTLIILNQFNKQDFNKYIKLGFTYILSQNVFPYLVPAVIENLDYFLGYQITSPSLITYKSLQICCSCGYIILKDCKIFLSKSSLTLITILIKAETYCTITKLEKDLEMLLGKNFSDSYITVTISRTNNEIFQATGLKLIKNRYGFGYYLDI